MTLNYSFNKTERLSSVKVINELFAEGRKFNNYPFRIVWKLRESRNLPRAKILISVPKRVIALAVERNLIKRRIRESYRKNKNLLLLVLAGKTDKSVDIAFIFTANKIIEYNEIEKKVISSIYKLVEFF